MEDTLREAEAWWGKKEHFMLQNYSSLSEIVSVMSLQHLAEATEIL